MKKTLEKARLKKYISSNFLDSLVDHKIRDGKLHINL